VSDAEPTPSGAPLHYRVSGAATRGGGAHLELAQRRVELDAAWNAPASGDPGPADLLGGAFAACLLKNLARAGELLGFSYESAELEVVLRRQEAPPRFTHIDYTMRIVTDEPERRLELLHTNLRKFGTVYNTLAAVCEVTGTVTRAG